MSGVFCKRNGVDLIKVIKAIKMSYTRNIIFQDGVGDYCLPKDGGLLGLPSYSGF